MGPKPLARRLMLLSSAAALGAEIAFPGSGRAAPDGVPDVADRIADLRADVVPTQAALAELRRRKIRAVRPHNPASLRDARRNPYLAPVGEPLSAAEQARNRPQAASGSGL